MANVTISWTTVGVPFPASTDLTQYRVLVDGIPAAFVPFGSLSTVFPDVPPGDYTARVALANADGSHVELERSAPFTVHPPTVALDAPDIVSVQVG